MTEVLINNQGINEWYQVRPIIKTPDKSVQIKEEIYSKIVKKSIFSKIRNFFFKKLNEGEKIKPVLSVNRVKAQTYTKLGTTLGATLGTFIPY